MILTAILNRVVLGKLSWWRNLWSESTDWRFGSWVNE